MEQQKTFSHGLLYSVPPQNFSSLHLEEERGRDEFEWEGLKANFSGKSIARKILPFLRKAASALRIIPL